MDYSLFIYLSIMFVGILLWKISKDVRYIWSLAPMAALALLRLYQMFSGSYLYLDDVTQEIEDIVIVGLRMICVIVFLYTVFKNYGENK